MSATGSDCFICEILREASDKTQVLDDRSADFTVLICPQCDVPMAVLRSHDIIFPPRRYAVMREALFAAAEEWSCGKSLMIDEIPHQETTHLCWHARPGV